MFMRLLMTDHIHYDKKFHLPSTLWSFYIGLYFLYTWGDDVFFRVHIDFLSTFASGLFFYNCGVDSEITHMSHSTSTDDCSTRNDLSSIFPTTTFCAYDLNFYS